MDELMLIELIGKVMDERVLILDDKMNRRMTALEESLDSKLENLQSDVTSIKDDIASLQSDVTGVKGDIASLQNDVASMKDDITSLQSDFTGMKDDVKSMKSDITGMQGDIGFIKDHVVSLDNHMGQMIHKFIPELRSGILEIRQDNRALSHMYGEHSLEIKKLKT